MSLGLAVLPQKHQTVRQVGHSLGISDAQVVVFERLFGLKTCPADERLWMAPMLLKACHSCLEQTGVQADDIRALLYAHTGPVNQPYPQTAPEYLIRQLGLSQAIGWGSNMNKCAAAFMLLKYAARYIEHLKGPMMMVMGDIAFTPVLRHIPSTTITTEGAQAMMLSNTSGQFELLSVYTSLEGAYALQWLPPKVQQAFEARYASALTEVIQAACEAAQLSLSDIRYVCPHNVNTHSWCQVADQLGVPLEKIYLENIPNTAHCFGVDPFYNLQCIQKSLLPGDKVLCATAGLGATFAAMVLSYQGEGVCK